MEGFILLLYLDGNMEYINSRQSFPYISWSPYDRIQIKRVESINQFFEAQFRTKWIGVAQQMHLIHEYPRSFEWNITENPKEDSNALIRTKDSQHVYGLCSVVTVRLKKGIANTKEFRKAVYEQLGADKNSIEGIEWNAFYCLGAEDIVFLVLANDMRKIQDFMNLLVTAEMAGKGDDLFSAVNSFMNINDTSWKGRTEAGLLVRLTLKSGREDMVQPVIQKLVDEMKIPRENIQKLLMGKAVFDVRIPADKVDIEWYSKGHKGIFNGECPFYEQYIASSRSYWIVGERKCPGKVSVRVEEIEECEIKDEDSQEGDIEQLLQLCGKVPMAQFVIKEYQRLIQSSQSGWWTPVLEKQFQIVKKLLRDFVENEKMKQLNLLLRQIQNVLLHIRQSTISTTEVPYLNYTYAGSYNDIMKMYYGMISELFQIGYLMEHAENCQYEITFCVDFESTSDVHSEMYMLSEQSKTRFVVFHLPFDAFTDIEKTVQYLSHEVFHYIAPYSRKRRNRLLLDIWCRRIIQKDAINLIKKYKVDGDMRNSIEEEYFSKSSTHMEKICDRIYAKILNKIHGYDQWIINKFMGEDVNIFRDIYDIVLKEFIDDLFDRHSGLLESLYKEITKKESLSVIMEEMRKIVYQSVNGWLQSDISYYYAGREMERIAHAYRETFCDYNMIRLFGMDEEEYLLLFYNLLVKRYVSPDAGDMFQEAQNEQITIDSSARRIGMVFDEILGIRGVEEQRIQRSLKKVLETSTDYNFNNFINYVGKIDREYQCSEMTYRKQYQNLFSEINSFWDDTIPEAAQKIRDNFQKIKGCNENLEKSMSVLYAFSNKEIKFTMPQQCFSKREMDQVSNLPVGLQNNSYKRHRIENVGGFIERVYMISEDMITKSGEKGQPCWYRGVCNKEYSLLPSLYRKYDDYAKMKVKRSLYSYQTKILQDAYYLTMKMSDLWTEQLHGVAEHTCCLQHYGMPTTLLDFSLDMLVALYFALTPDREKDQEEIDIGNSVPKVVIFNPVLYNKAIYSLKEGRILSDEAYIQCSPVMFDVADKEMEEFFVYNMSADCSIESTKKFNEKLYISDPRIDLYPKPIIIQQTNSRVLAQNGIFMAYNLNALPTDSKEPFKYLDLKQIQEIYLSMFKNERKMEGAKFLQEIYIHPIEAAKMRRELELLGLNRGRVYPELSEIFKTYQR